MCYRTSLPSHCQNLSFLPPLSFPVCTQTHTHMAPNKASFHVKHEVSTREHKQAARELKEQCTLTRANHTALSFS